MRVPTPNVSLVELVFLPKELSIKKINSAFEEFANKQRKKFYLLLMKSLFHWSNYNSDIDNRRIFNKRCWKNR